MLLHFKCNNFKSFRDGFDFNMMPEARMTEMKTCILEEKTGNKSVYVLPVSVVYGMNGAGKTSVVNAMSCFRQIIVKGTIEDSEDESACNSASINMKLIPFFFSEQEEPVSFEITFIYRSIMYRYELAFTVGKFGCKDVERKIVDEKLYINDVLIFHRTSKEVLELSLSSVRKMLNVGYRMEDTEKQRVIMEKNLSPTSLLLTTDFNSFCSKAIVSRIKEWMSKQLVVVNSIDFIQIRPNTYEKDDLVLLNKILKEAGILDSDCTYIIDSQTHSPKLASEIENTEDSPYMVDANLIASEGTMRLFSVMPRILNALRNGSTLVIDSLDTALHPMLVMNLVNLFQNDEVNRSHAQLIFNTHNPIYLNNKLLRRDEIKFVERDKNTRNSSLYALSDFKTNGEASVRKTSDYMKNYFLGRYGAIENIDFTDIVVEMLSEEKEATNG